MVCGNMFQDSQRIQVAKELNDGVKTLKITVERHDAALGWYTAGALALPLHQLPLLQQALEEINCTDCAECVDKECRGKIISFPLLTGKSFADLAEAPLA
jgi:hypothetical protein